MSWKNIVHLLLFGFLLALTLLLVFGLPTAAEENRRIVINDSDLAQLRATWIRQWQREPTTEELRGLIQQFVKEEVYYREALARGFDKNDQVVRRAMQQKMEFLGATQAEDDAPTDEEIQAYFALRSEKYRIPGSMSFIQIYFNQDRRGEQTETDARQALSQLQGMPPDSLDLNAFGDPIMLEQLYRNLDENQISALFGTDFATEMVALEPEKWVGPVRSGYGLHLVYVLVKENSRIPEWTEIKPALLQDMQFEATTSAKELFYTEILRNYQVVYRGQTLDLIKEEAQ